MTKNELVELVYEKLKKQKTELSRRTIRKVINQTLNSITDCVACGDEIMLKPLGKFSIKARKARRAKNMITGEDIVVLPRYVATFSPAKELDEKTKKIPIDEL